MEDSLQRLADRRHPFSTSQIFYSLCYTNRLKSIYQSESSGAQEARRSISIVEDVRVSYTLPLPITSIIRTDSIEMYQPVFIFLIQLQRAKYLLRRQITANTAHTTDQKPVLQVYTFRHRLL